MKHMVLRPNRSATPLKTLHIAADFGTTFSASAYAKDFSSGQTFSLNHIKAVTGWPDGDIWHGRDVTEVPTELVYEEGKRHPVAWGWEARNMMRETWRSSKLRTYHLVRFKLLLSRKDDSKNERREILEILARDGRSVIDVIVDFLTPFREHILKHIQRGMEDDDEYQSWAHQWTLSVPADWTPLARRQMLEAAEQAGFNGVVKLISEPEASGLYMIETEVDDQLHMTVSRHRSCLRWSILTWTSSRMRLSLGILEVAQLCELSIRHESQQLTDSRIVLPILLLDSIRFPCLDLHLFLVCASTVSTGPS